MGPANADLPTGNRRLRWPLGALLLVACASVIAGSGCATGHQGSPALRARSDKLVVGAIHVGSIDDKGYNQAMHEGLMAMKESLPNVELIEVENIPESQDAETAMEKLAGQGAHLIFPMSFGYLQYALNVAKRHPEVIFEHPGGTARSDNLGTFWSDTSSLHYLMGIVAGSATKTGKLGWVIGHPVPNILASINAFQLGAQSVNPGVTTYVTVTNAWLDPPQEQSAVRSLAADGADVLTMIVDSPVTVVRTADELGLKSIGFHCLCLQGVAGNGWLTGVGFEWGGLFTEMARDVMAGTWKSEDKIGGIAEGSARIAPYAAEVSPETRSRVEKAKLALISGELRLFTGPVYDNHGRVVIPEGQSADVAKLIGTTDYLVQGVVGQLK